MEGFWVEADFFPCPLLMGGCKKPSSCAFLLTAFQGMKLKLLRQGCQACPSWVLSPFPSLRPPAVCWEVLWAHSGLLAVGGQSVLQLWVSPRRHEVVALASGTIQAALNSLPTQLVFIIALNHVQNLAFGLVELREVCMHPLLKPEKFLWMASLLSIVSNKSIYFIF